MSFRIDTIPNRRSTPQILLRHTTYEGRRVRHKTIGNLTRLPPHIVEGLRVLLKGGVAHDGIHDLCPIRRSLPHGHVAVALAAARACGLPRILARSRGRHADLALAAIVARVVQPASKLATARQLSPETASSSLGTILGLGHVRGNEMLAMLDWLRGRQPWIERSLARRHLGDGTLILYDVTSSYLEGRRCPLAAFGYNRDRKAGRMQIVYGLLCSADGCPVAVEVFEGNTSDPATVATLAERVRGRFGIDRVAIVGDRGMLTSARIRDDLRPAGLDWVSALRTTEIRKLAKKAPGADAPVLFPEELVADAVAEVVSPEFPGERLMVCPDPRLRAERARKRGELLAATERALRGIADAAARARPGPDNRDRVHEALGAHANRWRVRKHFTVEVTEDGMTWARDEGRIAEEARLDGVHVIRTSLGPDAISSEAAVEAYKGLSRIERAFRGPETTRPEVRPVHVHSAGHVRGHVLLCMLAWHLEWHMRRALAPLLLEDDDRGGARARRGSPVAPATVSRSARAKAATRRGDDGPPVHDMASLLADLATLTLNEVAPSELAEGTFLTTTQPTPLQARALELMGMDPEGLPACG